MKEKDINVKERRTDFLSMWKDFWNPIPEEETEEERILKDDTITESDKKELLKALKSADKLSSSLFRNSYKTTRLKVGNLKGSAKDSLGQKSNQKDKNVKNIDDSQLEK